MEAAEVLINMALRMVRWYGLPAGGGVGVRG